MPVLSLPVPERFGSRFTVRFVSHTELDETLSDYPFSIRIYNIIQIMQIFLHVLDGISIAFPFVDPCIVT